MLSPALAPPCGLDKKWGHWWITEDKALRSEYLAWPAAHIVRIELQLQKTTSIERIIKQLLISMLILRCVVYPRDVINNAPTRENRPDLRPTDEENVKYYINALTRNIYKYSCKTLV